MTQQILWIMSHLDSISEALTEILKAKGFDVDDPDAKDICLMDAINDVHAAKAALKYYRELI